MAEITPVTEGASALSELNPGGQLGKAEFLHLLTTQLSHQDPLDPMDSAAMVSQLAEFSALEQMENLNLSMSEARREDGLMQALSLNGESVNALLDDGSQVTGTVEKVSWENNGISLVINGESHALSGIISITKATTPAT